MCTKSVCKGLRQSLTVSRATVRRQEAHIKALEANLEFIERVKGVNEKYANALAFLEMGENDDPEEFAECFWNKFIALEAENAAQAARIKELEKLCNDTEAEALGYASDKAELEAKLAETEVLLQRALMGFVADDKQEKRNG